MAIDPQDLFSANQIIHLRPTFGQRVFEQFVASNEFVRAYYPNFELKTIDTPSSSQGVKSLVERALSIGPAQLAERVARTVYQWHLRRKAATWQSRDQVKLEPECLKLHTSSHRAETMARFAAALENATTKTTKAIKVLAS